MDGKVYNVSPLLFLYNIPSMETFRYPSKMNNCSKEIFNIFIIVCRTIKVWRVGW